MAMKQEPYNSCGSFRRSGPFAARQLKILATQTSQAILTQNGGLRIQMGPMQIMPNLQLAPHVRFGFHGMAFVVATDQCCCLANHPWSMGTTGKCGC